jgi:dTDP-4-amino-4,6-dideoxygalactose transaminase
VEPLAELPDRRHVFHLYVVRAPDRDRLQADLQDSEVATLIHYPIPIHRQPSFDELAEGASLRSSEALCDSVLSLPLFPGLTDDEVEAVATAAVEASAAQPAN